MKRIRYAALVASFGLVVWAVLCVLLGITWSLSCAIWYAAMPDESQFPPLITLLLFLLSLAAVIWALNRVALKQLAQDGKLMGARMLHMDIALVSGIALFVFAEAADWIPHPDVIMHSAMGLMVILFLVGFFFAPKRVTRRAT